MNKKEFFVDTNLFLQCKDLNEIPWAEIADGKDILLLIPRAVQEEIDNLKNDGNSRRARKARKTNTLLKKIIFEKDSLYIIREIKPRVEITFPPPLASNNSDINWLDLNKIDDIIISDAIVYSKQNKEKDILLLTHDTNPILTAKRCGLKCVMIPDNWLLPPEPDERDKKINDLEIQLKKIKQTFPEIQISISFTEKHLKSSNCLTIDTYNTLSESEKNKLIDMAKTQNPMVTDFSKQEPKELDITNKDPFKNIFEEFKPPSNEDIEKYQKEEYPNWIKEIKKYFDNLPGELESPYRFISLECTITNIGNVPAENFIVEFEELNGLLFAPPLGDHKTQTHRKTCEISEFPIQPKTPQAKWVHKEGFESILKSSSLMRNCVPSINNFINPINIKKEKDIYSFYWKPDKPSASEKCWSFECKEFRHKVDSKVFYLEIFVPFNFKIDKGIILCKATAKNMPDPLVEKFLFDIKYRINTTFEKAKSILVESIRGNLIALNNLKSE